MGADQLQNTGGLEMKGFAKLWAVIFALVVVINSLIMSQLNDGKLWNDGGDPIGVILAYAGISFLLSGSIYLLGMVIKYLPSMLWMVLRYLWMGISNLASKLSGS